MENLVSCNDHEFRVLTFPFTLPLLSPDSTYWFVYVILPNNYTRHLLFFLTVLIINPYRIVACTRNSKLRYWFISVFNQIDAQNLF